MCRKALWLIIFIIFTHAVHTQWIQVSGLPGGEIGAYPSISSPDKNTVVVAGGNTNNPRIYRSTNGGINFTNITGSITGAELYSVCAINADTIFAGNGGSPGGLGGNAKVYMTVNGGLNWTVVLTTGGNSGFISGISFSKINPDFGLIVSDPAIENDSFWVAKTTNRGTTWIVKKAPNSAQYTTQNSIFVVDEMFYGFGLNASPSKFYLTTNGGNSWIVKTIGLNGFSVPSVAFRSDKLTGIAISDVTMPNIAITSTGGSIWQTVNIGTNSSGIGTVKWVPGTPVFYLASNRIKRSSNNGIDWFEMSTSGIQNFSHMDLSVESNELCAYALASDGKILKYMGDPFGIDPSNTTVPVNFSLEQNFPNPFNPSTTIKYSIPVAGLVTIKVFDAAGREIKQVVNSFHHAGNFIENIEMNEHSSGIYIYTMLSGNINISRKMVLMK
jgi:hypothetical protein